MVIRKLQGKTELFGLEDQGSGFNGYNILTVHTLLPNTHIDLFHQWMIHECRF